MERQDRGSCGYGAVVPCFRGRTATRAANNEKEKKRRKKKENNTGETGWLMKAVTGNRMKGRGEETVVIEKNSLGERGRTDRSQASRMNRQFRGFSNKRKQRIETARNGDHMPVFLAFYHLLRASHTCTREA